jgi:hypothetical protein
VRHLVERLRYGHLDETIIYRPTLNYDVSNGQILGRELVRFNPYEALKREHAWMIAFGQTPAETPDEIMRRGLTSRERHQLIWKTILDPNRPDPQGRFRASGLSRD